MENIGYLYPGTQTIKKRKENKVFGATRNQMARKRLENKRFQLRQDLPRPRGPPAWAEMPSANLQSKKCLKTNGKRMKK